MKVEFLAFSRAFTVSRRWRALLSRIDSTKPLIPFDAALHAIHASAHRLHSGICGIPELRTTILRYVPSIEGCVGLPVSYSALRDSLVMSSKNWLAGYGDADLEQICELAELLRPHASERRILNEAAASRDSAIR